MNPAACNFYIASSFNANTDITWSFEYALTGNALSSSGGFCTFLFNSDNLSATGGFYQSLGYGPYQGLSGIPSNIIGIGFDSTGLFAMSGGVFSSGLSSRSPNSLTIRIGSNFTYLTSFSLTALGIPLIQSSESFETLRFNFTELSQILKIAIKDKTNNRYTQLLEIPTGLSARLADAYQIGFSYATPISSGHSKTVLKFKNIHVQGLDSIPDRDTNETSGLPTNYILQSPLSGLIQLAPDEDSYLTNSDGV